MKIIPAIDIIDGKVVRLSQGDYKRVQYYDFDPLYWAQSIEDIGVEYLHFVDLEAAKSKKLSNLSIVEKIASKTDLKIDFGGGVTDTEDALSVLNAGAEQINIGSLAVKDSKGFMDIVKRIGPDKLILSVDILGEYVYINGWQDKSDFKWKDLIGQYQDLGIEKIVSTDIEKDGMLNGPSQSLYRDMGCTFPELKIIASGGISKLDDFEYLSENGCWGAITGKALLEGKIKLKELRKYVD
jgi:phosphoribosylformimino-5-aminoimidazole carboxamide ribotide isomerase